MPFSLATTTILLLLTVSATQTLTLPAPLIQCTPSPLPPLHLPPPLTPHCAIALRSLPSIQAIGPFHHSSPADDFLLPIQRLYGSCHVSVELVGGRTEETSSWLQIGLAATQLAMACVDAGKGEKMGGRTVAGAGGGIVVTVRESGGMVVRGVNETVVGG